MESGVESPGVASEIALWVAANYSQVLQIAYLPEIQIFSLVTLLHAESEKGYTLG